MSAICPKYQQRKCWQTGAVENEVICGGDCNRCSLSGFENVPTFKELMAAYEEYAERSSVIRRNTANSHKVALNTLFRYSELEPGDKITALSEEVWERFILNARQHISPISIKGVGEKVHGILSKSAIRYFRSMKGWNCPPFPTLSAEAKDKPWVSLSKEETRKLRDYQFALYDLADPRKYLCVTAAWERGQRKCDALRNHWSQFKEREGAIWWPYVSVKNGKP